MKRPINITISEEARRLLTLHAERSGISVSGLIERLIREEEARWEDNLRQIAQAVRMLPQRNNFNNQTPDRRPDKQRAGKMDEYKIIELAGTRLWPSNEPATPDATRVLGGYRSSPPDFIMESGQLMAVGYDNDSSSYSGGGTGPIRCRLYKADTLIESGGPLARKVGLAMKQLYAELC